ncbi:MAG: extracellular solute-binding protein [Chloroflexi bacterium]|nr:extracellular solute-binding protein [Chloroflexota bacterium]MCY3937209.1 extracellular solute-binding protein [Chloroflexota bacterium]
MNSSNQKLAITRRRFLALATASAGILAAACGADESPDFSGMPALTERQKQVLEESADVASAGSRSTRVPLPSQPLKVHPLWSTFGPTRGQYRGVVNRAGSLDEAAPRLEMVRFRQAVDGNTIGRSIALMADTEPLDLLVFPAEALQDLEDNDLLVPLDKVSDVGEAVKSENYWPGMLESGRIKGRQLAIPLQAGPWLLMYREKQLEEYGIADPSDLPWNAEQFSENTSRLTLVGGDSKGADQYGFLQMVSTDSTNISISVPPSWVWMVAAGSRLPDREGYEEALQEPAAIAGLGVMNDLINRHRSVYKVTRTTSGRQIRGLINDRRVLMMSFPVNSGWFLSTWRDAVSNDIQLAALPGGDRRRTPTEVHMMVGVSSWSEHTDFAMAALANMYKSVGDQVFPSAVRADLGMMATVAPALNPADTVAIQAALERSQPINLSKVEKKLLTERLDSPIALEQIAPEEAAKGAAEALLQFRIAEQNRRNRPPAPPPGPPPGTG